MKEKKLDRIEDFLQKVTNNRVADDSTLRTPDHVRLQYFVSIILLITISYAIQCPRGKGCGDCKFIGDDKYEIECLTNTPDSMFIVTYKPHSLLRIHCYYSKNWSQFHLGNEQQIHDVDAISFLSCRLPEGRKLGTIARQIVAIDIKKLSLELIDDLTWTLSRETLAGFKSLENLDLNGNGLKNVTTELLHDLQNLTTLSLAGNDLRELPTGFLDLDRLEWLDLSINELEVIEPTMFEKLGKLRTLHVWNNKLKEIKPYIFDKLKSLELINMQRNNLQTLPGDIFAKLKNLMTVKLSDNNFSINSLPERLFRNNSLLTTVLLMNNQQNLKTLPSKIFAGLTQLREVNIRGNKLVYLSEDFFKGNVNLQNLSMDWNAIEELPRDIVKDCKKLLSIKLNDNELRGLPNGIFSMLHELDELDLSSNHITTIDENMFDGLSSLRVLNMERNGLESIHPHGLRPLRNLRIARFSSNQLTLKPTGSRSTQDNRTDSPFYHCKKIEELHLSYNKISDIFLDWTVAPDLRTLNLKNNSLQMLETLDMFFSSEKLDVDLSFNQIKRISLANANEYAVYRVHPHDVTISLDNNPINCDCYLDDLLRYQEGSLHPNVYKNLHLKMSNLICQKPSWFKDLPIKSLTLESLICQVENPAIYNATCPQECECWINPEKPAYLVDCSYKWLREAPKSLKSALEFTIELNLTGNSLTKMPSMKQDGYDLVTVLSLSKNEITEVTLDALSRNLQVLNLDSNGLTRLETPVLDFLKISTKLKNLTLQMNPWACDCNSREFLSFLQQKVMVIPELQEVHCEISDAPIFKMKPEDMCPLAIAVIIGACISVALLGILIGIIATLYYRFQQEIKVWLYAKQWCLWFVTEDELDKDKLYDAFISYSYKDEAFVKDLIAELEEGEKPFKLCIHYRDWLAGEWIPTQIVRSVEESRRTIVVLSPNFLESVWGKMEFRTAHYQALSEGRTRVIVILYGEIGPMDQLDPELRVYLTMNTYVKWGDPRFWEKLKYALPHGGLEKEEANCCI